MDNVKWIFFDIGSTLVDESECFEIRYKETTDNTPVKYSEFKNKVIEFSAASDNPYEEAVKFFKLKKTKWRADAEKPFPHIEKVLAYLSEKYNLGIIANQSPGCGKRLAVWGIGKYFDLIVSSAEAGTEKPNPEIFNLALKKAGCKPENAVMVGDRIDNDILPAKNTGMKTVWVKQGFAKYQKASDLPDYTIYKTEEIIDIL